MESKRQAKKIAMQIKSAFRFGKHPFFLESLKLCLWQKTAWLELCSQNTKYWGDGPNSHENGPKLILFASVAHLALKQHFWLWWKFSQAQAFPLQKPRNNFYPWNGPKSSSKARGQIWQPGQYVGRQGISSGYPPPPAFWNTRFRDVGGYENSK